MVTWHFRDEWLLRAALSVKGVDKALVEKARSDRKPLISHVLIDSGALTKGQLVGAVEAMFRVKYFPLTEDNVDKFGLTLLKEKLCRKHGFMPVAVSEAEIRVAMSDPTNIDAQADIEALTGRRTIALFSLPHEVDGCMEKIFSADSLIFDLLSKVGVADDIMVVGAREEEEDRNYVSAPVVQLVNSIISQAYRKRSSDIHIEHEEKASHVRIRVDGVLKNIMTLPRHVATGPVVSRIKIMAELDVSNHLRPQDGRTKLRISGAEVGLRVSTLPTSYGEKVVMRILDQRAAEVPFEKLGFAPEVAAGIDKCVNANQGIILVTGPTGSGKTTTLYSVLNKCKDETTNIVTVEDPIEYKLVGINQVQVNEKQGLSFAAVLRSVLRQDPDIIMLGEIRDRETADIAFQAAMTGHLVLSTLHTNDTVSTISRLADMGVDRFKISPGLLAITAQRLVRKICPLCAEIVPEAERDHSIVQALTEHGFDGSYWRGPGCKNCEGSGYVGRTSVVELLMVDSAVKELINSGVKAEEIAASAQASGSLRTMTHDILWQMSQGRVDLAEGISYMDLSKAPPPTQAEVAENTRMLKSARGQASRPAPAPAPEEAPANEQLYHEMDRLRTELEAAQSRLDDQSDAGRQSLEDRLEYLRLEQEAAARTLQNKLLKAEDELRDKYQAKLKASEGTFEERLKVERRRLAAEFEDRAEVSERERARLLAEKAALEAAHAEKLKDLERALLAKAEAEKDRIERSLGASGLGQAERDAEIAGLRDAYEARVKDIEASMHTRLAAQRDIAEKLRAREQELNAREAELHKMHAESLEKLKESEAKVRNALEAEKQRAEEALKDRYLSLKEREAELERLASAKGAKEQDSDSVKPVAPPAVPERDAVQDEVDILAQQVERAAVELEQELELRRAALGNKTATPPAEQSRRAVMIVDDDPIMRMLLRKFIENSGYEVREAVDGEEALAAIAEAAPDLLISDIHMPRLNGLDLVKGVRQNLGLTDLPIILLTTESSDKSQQLAFSLGADDYIVKPFKGQLVMARINAALRRSGKIR